MSSLYRPSTPQDGPQIIELLAHAFSAPSPAAFLQPDLLRWKFWAPCEEWPEPRSWVVERDGRIAAHACLWPVIVQNGETTERGSSLIDWASDPANAGSGVFLKKHLGKMFDFHYSVGGSAMTQSILPRLGYRMIAQAVTWSRPLRPWKELVQNRSLHPRVTARLARNFWRAQIPSRSVNPAWTIAGTGPDSSDQPVPLLERGKAFFDFLDRCPIARCQTFHVLHNGRKVGWFALMSGKIQARVAGMWLEEPTAENWRMAFNLAQTAARDRTDAWQFSARCSTPASNIGAKQAGMHVARRSPVLFRSRTGSEPPPLQYHFCDNDDAFLKIQ